MSRRYLSTEDRRALYERRIADRRDIALNGIDPDARARSRRWLRRHGFDL